MLLIAVAAAAGMSAGCAKDRVFSVNGQVVTKDEYIHTLERQTVVVPGTGATSTGIKAAIDTIVGNRISLAEAAKENVLPSDDDVKRYYVVQKRLFEAQNPGKDYEQSMAEEGTSPDEVRDEMRVQLAQAAIYAKRLNLTETDIHNAYNMNATHGGFGLPARVQIRTVLADPNSPQFAEAQKALSSKSADFNAVADKINPASLRATHGIWPQAVNLTPGASNPLLSKLQQTAEGAFFGPVDFRYSPNPRVPAAKAWIKVEKKMPALEIPYEDAAQLVRIQLVQQKLRTPEAQAVRQDVIKQKLDASFEAANKYITVWDALKKSASAVLTGQQADTTAAAGLPGAAGAAAPDGAGALGTDAAATTPLTK